MGYTKRDTLRLLAGGTGALLFGTAARAETTLTSAEARAARREARRLARLARAEARNAWIAAKRAERLAKRNAHIAANTQLWRSYNNNFKIGAALTNAQIDANGTTAALAEKHFNSITTDFELKHPYLLNAAGEYDFTNADRLVNWAIANGKEVRGHTLLWHVETPGFMLEGTPEDIKARVEHHVSTVVGHFKGRITTWDVVNEVVSQDIWTGNGTGVGPDRRSIWYEAVGSADYIDWAFHAARQADPDAKLFLNDYNTEHPIAQAWLLEILNRLRERNVPIDGVGHQFHLGPSTQASDVLAAIDAVDNQYLGLINHVTELDMSMYEDPGSCWSSQTGCGADLGPVAPADKLAYQAQRLKDMFDGFVLRPSVESVSFWGVQDGESWLNNSPISRYDHPLLFDREGLAKPAFMAITNQTYVIPTE